MIKEIIERPFARPLFLFVSGIIIAVYFHGKYILAALLLLASAIVLLCSYFRKNSCPDYNSRFMWGILFSLLLLFISIVYTDIRLSLPEGGISDLQNYALTVRKNLVASFSNLDVQEKERSVLATLVLGDRESMSRELTNSFSAAGVVHILSVSGFHVAVLYMILSRLFSLFGKMGVVRVLDFVSMMLCVWGFTFVSGSDSPTVRSALMITLFSFGNLIRRDVDGYNVWAASAFFMLLYNPFFLFDIGFQLSYLAVFSIQFFYSRIKNFIRITNPLLSAFWNGTALTLAAQVATMPLCMYYFREVPWVFIFTSVPVSWLSSCLIPLGLLWVTADKLNIYVPYLSELTVWTVNTIITLVEMFADVPKFRIVFDEAMLFLSYILLALLVIYIKYKNNKILLSYLFILFLMGLLCLR